MQQLSQDKPSPSPPLNKSCEPCRSLKVRCLPDEFGSSACQRCLKFNRACIFATPQRKKQRKRTEARVAELEKEIIAMRALLGQSQTPTVDSVSEPGPSYNTPIITTVTSSPNVAEPALRKGNTSPDVVDRGVLTLDEARRLLDLYRDEHAMHFPICYIPPDRTVEELRSAEPILFLAVMTTGSSKGRPELFSALSTEIIQEYVHRVMTNGEKSLEIVKAINVTSAWYFPTDQWASLKFYEYSHLASTLAIAIGLSDRSSVNTADVGEQYPDRLIMDRKRSLIACYAQCAALSLNLRRPNMLHFNSFMADVVQELELSPLLFDYSLSAFVRIINIGEEVNVALGLSDAGRESQLTERMLQQAIVDYGRKIQIWKDVFHIESLPVDLHIMAHYVTMVLHETPLHTYYSSSYFKPPFFLQGPTSQIPIESETSCAVLVTMTKSAQALLDLFIALDVGVVRTLPDHIFSRVYFALVVLIAVALLPDVPLHLELIGLQPDLPRVDLYVDATIHTLLAAAGLMEYRIPCVFAGPLFRLKKWWQWISARKALKVTNLDGGLVLGIFAGPSDHPALKMGLLEQNGNHSGSSTSSPLADQAATSRIAVASGSKNDGIGSAQEQVNDFDIEWLHGIEADLSSTIDPTLFEFGMDFDDMTGAFQGMEYLDESPS